ncbi:metallophosphoesterase family protein [Sorangium sp. So ce117]|uniref:metallophosphoesterase family protein n=1 Tax=Sorangium sp. So ce117 TaxID=3133277 RepID=UPI003F605A60
MQHQRDPAMAGIRFLHTADLQLGMPFGKIPGDAGAKLRERRLDVIDKLGEVARANRADFVLVAGDFFDANNARDRLVQQVLSRVRQAKVPFLVLPGNHDHAGAGSVYAHPCFHKECPENLVVLDRREPVPVLGGRAVILPAPLHRKRELGDPTAHLTPELGADEVRNAIRIGVAHGSMLDVARDLDGRTPNRIATDRAERAHLDYLALGDWHGMKRISDRTWYSGAPEPTSFKQNESGFALLVEIATHGVVPEVQPISVGITRWLVHEETTQGADDVQRLREWFDALEAPQDALVRLTLDGALARADMEALEQLLARMSNRLLHLEHDLRVRTWLTDNDLATVAVDGAVRSTIDRLRSVASSPAPQARAATRALLTLHRLAVAAGGPSC